MTKGRSHGHEAAAAPSQDLQRVAGARHAPLRAGAVCYGPAKLPGTTAGADNTGLWRLPAPAHRRAGRGARVERVDGLLGVFAFLMKEIEQ